METPSPIKSGIPAGRLFSPWLPAGAVLLVLLLVAATLLAEHYLSSPGGREKIRQALVAQTGMEIDYRQIGLDYFPAFSLEVRQLSFVLPGQARGKAESLRISPSIIGLLAGTTGLGTVELVRPDIEVEVPELLFSGKRDDAVTAPGGKANRTLILRKLQEIVPVLQVKSVDGRFAVSSGSRQLRGEHLNLHLNGVVEDESTGSLSLRLDLAELFLTRGDEQQTISGLSLQGDIRMTGGDLSCRLQRLAAAHPALTLSGTYSDPSAAGDVIVQLNGADIDVEATRGTALALAGEISPVKEIFSYLAGGKIPRIRFSSQGKTFADLGGLKAIRIDGQLQQGSVSVPEAALDLGEVSGRVTLADGILGGTGLTARLGNSFGHSGLFSIGFGDNSGLFQLELLADADLKETQEMLKRLIDQPAIDRELERISNLTGRGVGRLIIGNSFKDLKVAIKDAELSLSLDYQKVPLPIKITTGRLNYGEEQITLRALAGTVGRSGFSGVDATVGWAGETLLDLKAESAVLVADELYPWLNTLPGAQPLFSDFSEISGGIALSSLSLAGNAQAPGQWAYGAAGKLNNLTFVTRHFPGPVRLDKGAFQIDRSRLSLEGVEAAGLDARLRLTGTVSDYLQNSAARVGFTADGSMGDEAVAWLEKRGEVPEAYHIRTPVTLHGVKVAWQKEKGASVSGGFTVKDGPRLDLDLQARPAGLEVKKLAVKDQYSDARMTYSSAPENSAAGFSGGLRAETLVGLFAATAFNTGSVTGDFSVTLPGSGETRASATGRLQGAGLSIPLSAGDNLFIERLQLEADGSRVNADAAALSYRGFVIDPLRATVDLLPGQITATVDQAGFCGVDSPGVVKIAGKNIDLLIHPKGNNLDIRSSYFCLTQGRVKMTGRMDIAGRIKASGEMAELLGRMEGPLDITFSNGVIEQDKILAAILEVLNVTEIVKGRLPDMSTAGFKYTTMTIEGQFGNGKLRIKKLAMDGETLDILGYGEIDMEQESIKMELLAAPFQTVDTVIKYLPGVNYLLGGSLVAIPVSVQGKLADPRVRVMSPSSVSKSLLNLGARTIKLPFKLIESIIPGGN